MRQIKTLALSLLVLGCGARTDAFGDDPLEATGGVSGTETWGIGGYSRPNTLSTGGQIGWTTPPPTRGGAGWGGIPNTYTWSTGQAGWGVGGVTWGTIAVGGWGGVTSTTWTLPPKGGTTGTGGYSTKGGTTGTGGYKTTTGGYSTKGGTTGTGGYKTTTGGMSATGGTGGYKTTTGGMSATGGSGGAITTLVTQTCLQLATTSCQKCLCSVCAEPAVNCLSDVGCVNIAACVFETNCFEAGVSCYSPSKCKSVIDASGGFSSPSMLNAWAMASCVLTSACGC